MNHSMRLYHNDCMGQQKVDRLYHVQNMNQANIQYLPQWRALGNTGDLPVGWTPPSSNSSNSPAATPQIDPLALAGSLQQMQITANQPAIQTLQGQQGNLKDQYQQLLNSVLAQGTVASQYAQRAENSSLASRGIVPGTAPGGDVMYNQQMSQALLPVTAQNQSAAAQVGMGSAQDLNALAAQIAGLQAGNVPSAITGAGNLMQLQTLPQQIALLGAQAGAAKYVPIPGYGIYDTSTGKLLGGLSGVGDQGVTNVNGVPSVYIP